MSAKRAQERAGRQQLVVWLALSLTVGLGVTLILASSLAVSSNPLLMPLDDTYIHFQYARQWAHGHPLIYNPGDPATSGGTSLLYPPLLAVGYLLGFTGWSLAYWALGVGVLCLLGSAWLVYRIALDSPFAPDSPTRIGDALCMALSFALSGPFIWAALSGMETSLFVFSILLSFYFLQQDRLWPAVSAAVLMVLIRPEGLILAGLGVVALALRSWPSGWRGRFWQGAGLALPLLAGVIQPLINLAATGSTTSSGMQAKSHLYNTSQTLGQRLGKVLEFFGRLWGELLSGRSPDFGTFTSPLLAEIALAALLVGVWLAWRKRRVTASVIMLAWIAALTAAVATLDTAFWQFKRYQLPAMALFFPAAAWVSAVFGDLLEARLKFRPARWGLPLLILVPSTFTAITFARNYAENVSVVRDQQVPMARWVKANLPEDARIGAHDVGLVRYFGSRALYDVVGLTTPGPAKAWRQGPGAIYETMAHSAYRPDYFAIYPDVQGLRYLLNAGVFGQVLAEFQVNLPDHNVAAATGYQAVYTADWSNTRLQEQIAQPTTLAYVAGMTLVDQLDVADLDSEAEHAYRWWQKGSPPGFVTEVYHQVYRACGLAAQADCWATDGGRVLTGGEEFTLKTVPGQDLLLVTRVHGRSGVPLTVYVNDKRLGQRVQPAVPSRWIEVVTFIPQTAVTGPETRIRIVPQTADPKVDAYSPYYHWAYQGTYVEPPLASPGILATFGDEGGIILNYAAISQEPDQVRVDLIWFGADSQARDALVFVHLYNQDNLNTEPVAQVVARPAGDVLPPANWLPGAVRDSYMIPLPGNLAPGIYQVAIGLYDERTGQRYPVAGAVAEADRRLWIGKITVEESPQ